MRIFEESFISFETNWKDQIEESVIGEAKNRRNELENYFLSFDNKEKNLQRLKKLLVFLSETDTNPTKLSQTIIKYFEDLNTQLGKVYMTMPRDPPFIKNNQGLSDYRDFDEMKSKKITYFFLNNRAYSLNVNDSFLLTHQKLCLILMEIYSLNPVFKKDPYEQMARFINSPEDGLEILLLEKNVMEKSLDFSGRPVSNLVEGSLMHSNKDYKLLELDMIKLKYVQFIQEKFRTNHYKKINLRLRTDNILIYLSIIKRIFKPRYTNFNLKKTRILDFMSKKPLVSRGIDEYCEALLKKYFDQRVDSFLSDFEESVEETLKYPSFSNENSCLGLWCRLQIIEYYLNFNHNMKYQKKIIRNMKIVKSTCHFSNNLQFKIACLELQFLAQYKDIEQLLSLLNNLYFFEPFDFDVESTYEAIKKTFRLDLNPVEVRTILDKLMIVTNYEIQKCQIDLESKDHFLVDFWVYAFTQIDEVCLNNMVITLRTDRRLSSYVYQIINNI